MADLTVGSAPNDQFADTRRARGVSGATVVAETANMTSVSAMKTRLTALSATTYTAARLSAMTVNDMIYALRVGTGDAAGIK